MTIKPAAGAFALSVTVWTGEDAECVAGLLPSQFNQRGQCGQMRCRVHIRGEEEPPTTFGQLVGIETELQTQMRSVGKCRADGLSEQ